MASKMAETFISSTDNSRIYATAVGDSRKPSIIFVHGMGLSSIVFHRVLSDARLLEKFYLVICSPTLLPSQLSKAFVGGI